MYHATNSMINYIAKLMPKNALFMLSAGVDSISALHFVKTRTNLNPSAFHFNHKLRPQNDLMEKKAKEFCADFYIPLFVGVAEWKEGGRKTESGCRNARLNSLQRNFNQTLVTAHHLNDCVESYLKLAFEGKGAFLPIPFSTPLNKGGLIINHPFLLTKKRDFEEYAARHDLLKYIVQDETNADNKNTRNWLRNSIIPQIQERDFNLEKIIEKRIRWRLRE